VSLDHPENKVPGVPLVPVVPMGVVPVLVPVQMVR
jgi:hypothetical protein